MPKGGIALAALLMVSGVAAAQENSGQPLSAIDWLSRSVETPMFDAGLVPGDPLNGGLTVRRLEEPGAAAVLLPSISVSTIDTASPDVVGLLPSAVTGFPRTLWSSSVEKDLTKLVSDVPVSLLPGLRDLYLRLLLAEADAPIGAGPEGNLFLARVDRLLDLGAIDQANALLEAADPTTPDQFRRWFDVALLLGTEDFACAVMRDKPDVAPTYLGRIFCMARGGDWHTAALILNTGRALGDITDEEDALLSRFLDPDLYAGEPPLPIPSRVSPLIFRMREAIGEGVPTSMLPLAFAHADLRETAGWRAQLEAAERLARNGAVNENLLQALYTAHTPAASGGVWDRAAAFQAFDAALRSRDTEAIAATLPAAWTAMRMARTEVGFARLYGRDLAGLPLQGETSRLAFLIGLLSQDSTQIATMRQPTNETEAFLRQLALGDLTSTQGQTLRTAAIAAGFDGAAPPDTLAALLAEGKSGEALLRGIRLLAEGSIGDPSLVSQGLRLLRAMGLEADARRIALQYLILERPL